MNGQGTISPEIIASYAADAAKEVAGVRALVDGHLPGRKAVRVSEAVGAVRLELHLAVDWDASIPAVGRAVQMRVREYLLRMADVQAAAVDVVVDEIGPRPGA
jgi:uncharacterized alkaline shock family protein YloU